MATVQHGATVVLYLASALVAGASISTLWIARGHAHWSVERLPAIGRCALAGSVMALVASFIVLCLESAAMAEVPWIQAYPAVESMLNATHYGTAWTVGAAALALAVALNLFMPRRFAKYQAIGTGAALLVFWYTRSMVSHAASQGDFSLPLLVDWVHLVLISLWTGEVFVAALVIMRGRAPGREDDRRDRAAYVAALSTSATFGLAGIFATGLFAAWHDLGAIRNLVDGSYGRTLLAKLAVVGIAALLGAFNRFVVMPDWLSCEAAGRPAPTAMPHRFRVVLQVEALVLSATLLLAVVLASTSPPDSTMSF